MIQNSKAAKKVILILILVVIIGLAVQSIILMVINHYAPVESIRSEEDIAEIMEVRVFCLNLKYLIHFPLQKNPDLLFLQRENNLYIIGF